MEHAKIIPWVAAGALLCGCGPARQAVPPGDVIEGALVDAAGNPAAATLPGTGHLLLYFSAHWCPPCRTFTPKLVEFYRRNGGGRLFEAVLVSSDRDEAAMLGYMRETAMPWPAVRHRSESARILDRHYGGGGIPRLVLLNARGDVVADSFNGRQYIGPQNVLDTLAELLAGHQPAALPDAEPPAPPRELAGKYRIEGFGRGNERDFVVINGQIISPGDAFGDGAVIDEVGEGYVGISFDGKGYRLYP